MILKNLTTEEVKRLLVAVRLRCRHFFLKAVLCSTALIVLITAEQVFEPVPNTHSCACNNLACRVIIAAVASGASGVACITCIAGASGIFGSLFIRCSRAALTVCTRPGIIRVCRCTAALCCPGNKLRIKSSVLEVTAEICIDLSICNAGSVINKPSSNRFLGDRISGLKLSVQILKKCACYRIVCRLIVVGHCLLDHSTCLFVYCTAGSISIEISLRNACIPKAVHDVCNSIVNLGVICRKILPLGLCKRILTVDLVVKRIVQILLIGLLCRNLCRRLLASRRIDLARSSFHCLSGKVIRVSATGKAALVHLLCRKAVCRLVCLIVALRLTCRYLVRILCLLICAILHLLRIVNVGIIRIYNTLLLLLKLTPYVVVIYGDWLALAFATHNLGACSAFDFTSNHRHADVSRSHHFLLRL